MQSERRQWLELGIGANVLAALFIVGQTFFGKGADLSERERAIMHFVSQAFACGLLFWFIFAVRLIWRKWFISPPADPPP